MANPSPKSNPIVGPPGLTPVLQDWWRELNCPRIFGAARLGLRPGRIGLAFFAIVTAILLLKVGLSTDARLVKTPIQWPVWPCSADAQPREHILVLWRAAVTLPKRLIAGIPFTMIVVGPILLSILAIMLGAIARISACEMCHARTLTWTEGLRFAIPRWKSLVGAVVGPLLIAWVIAAAMVLAGWVFLHLPGLNIVGALLYGIFLLGGFLATLVLVGYALGHGLLIPAVACEGSDAIDAIQRAYTYFFARPIRLLLYTLIAIAGLILTVGIVALLVMWTIGFAAESAAVWSGPHGLNMVWNATTEAIRATPGLAGIRPLHPDPTSPAASVGTWAAGAWLIQFWTTIPILLVFAAWISCSISACTAVYLGIRQACDGQDWAELWTPGMIPGTMAQVSQARALVAQESGVAAGPSPIPPSDDDEE